MPLGAERLCCLASFPTQLGLARRSRDGVAVRESAFDGELDGF